MSKCILLVRVSTEGQDLSQQTEKVKEEAIKDGFKPKDIITLEDKESAVKLSEEERNGLNRMKWHVENDNVSCVYTYEVSRISRRPAVLYSIRDYLIKHNVQLVVLNPYMKMLNDDGTMSTTASLFFSIFTGMAEQEGYLRKARLKRGVEKKKSLGLHAGGPISIGWTTDSEDRYVIDPDGAAIVVRIFNDYINGWSMKRLAVQLQSEGWRTNTSIPTLIQSIRNILHRELYCGDEHHPAIITRDMFEAAQEKSMSKISYMKHQHDEPLLKGIIRDKATGLILSSNKANDQYYSKRVGQCTIKIHIADAVAWGLVKEWYNQTFFLKRDELEKDIDKMIERQESIISNMKSKLTDIQDKIDRIEERYIDGKISKEKADELEKKAFTDTQNYKKTLNEAISEKERLSKRLEDTRAYKQDIENASRQEKIDIIKDIVSVIYVTRTSRFVVRLEFHNRYTNEVRSMSVNTKAFRIFDIKVQLLPGLSDGSR